MKVNKNTQEVLASLPREQLRQMLQEELGKDTAGIDEKFVRLLMAELQRRGSDPKLADDAAVEAVCEKFRQDTKKAAKPKKYRYPSWMMTTAAIVLVLGILFFALPGGAEADNVSEVIGWWSDSVFQFLAPGQTPNTEEYVYETDHPGLQQLYDAVTELGITEPIVPRWLPDGFELAELQISQIAEDQVIFSRFISEQQRILYLITIRTGEMALQHEKDKNLVHIWDLAGCEHYVVSNDNEQIVTWVKGGAECTFTTDCPEEDVYQIIKSIYTSED